ncbi:hypothetical protein [Sphingosinicella sp.]|uniref:hypothetical protein n=1 Tax=Sphingosinicella sp. TaxID=1917971 RepID=UPI0035B0842F
MSKLVLISRFAVNALSGHFLLDDEYYFHFLNRKGVDFRLYTSRYSAERILNSFPADCDRIHALEDGQPRLDRGDRVIFLGFSEVDVIVFLLKNLLRLPRLVLIATNNFSSGRIARYRTFLKIFLLLINGSLERLVLHTAHERRLVTDLDKRAGAKAVIKKHHMMMPQYTPSMDFGTDQPIIAYFGPEKREKPIDPLLCLIRADRGRRFLYRLYNVDRALLRAQLPDIAERSNVQVVDGWQSHESYLRAARSSTLLFLSHTRDFEGKLSGNLCDSFALGIPYIARAMEPMTSYHVHYGPLGYLVDFDDPDWPEYFRRAYSPANIARMRGNLHRLGIDHSADAIDTNLAACLLD